jgi:heat shock protein HslJ
MTDVKDGGTMSHSLLPGIAGVVLATALAACAAPATTGVDAPAPAWPDSRWNVVAIADAGGALATVPAGIGVDLAIDAAGGRASGSAGCNRWSAGATIDGARIAFGPAAASKRYCGAPEGVMAVEGAFLAALGRVAQARSAGGRVQLCAEDGAVLLELERAAPG